MRLRYMILTLILLPSLLSAGIPPTHAELVTKERWVTVTACSEGSSGEYGSIAVDADGVVHIVSFQWLYDEWSGDTPVPFGNLLYTTNAGGVWSSTVLEAGAGMTPRIALGSGGGVHIVHTRIGIGNLDTILDLLYTTNLDGTWTTEAIHSGTVKGADASIALDSAGDLHICCSNEEGAGSPSGSEGGLRYITNRSGSWIWFDLDTNPDTGHDTDIIVDPNGAVHISYLHASQGLGYATDSSGVWTTAIVDPTPNVGWNTSIGSDCHGMVHISYSDPGPILDPPGAGLLKVASGRGDAWTIEVVDDDGAGYYTGLAVDRDGAIYVAYLDLTASTGHLNLAVKRWGRWTIEMTADLANPAQSVGLYAAIVVDDKGRPHISHYDYALRNLLYTSPKVWPLDLLPPKERTPTRALCRKAPSDRLDLVTPEVMVPDWSVPRPVTSLNTPCPEDAIEISSDGARLYFMFTQDLDEALCPVSLLAYPNGTHVATRTGDPADFSVTAFYDLGRGIDSSFDAELSFSPDGREVYFHSLRETNTGYQQDPPTNDFLDIYTAQIIDGRPGPAVNLGPPVNSPYPDGEQAIHPDGVTLYFTSHRPASFGGANIWISTKVNGTWSEPLLPGAPINSDGDDLQPAFTDGGSTIYFASNRDGGTAIYRSSMTTGGWGPAEEVVRGNVGEPSLTDDGQLLYFVHVLIDEAGLYDADIWVSERVR